MPERPDFYCFFYCAAGDGLRGPGTARHQPGSLAGLSPRLAGSRNVRARGRAARCPRSSGSPGLQWPAQLLIPAGRPGIDGLRVWLTSPLGSIRRGR